MRRSGDKSVVAEEFVGDTSAPNENTAVPFLLGGPRDVGDKSPLGSKVSFLRGGPREHGEGHSSLLPVLVSKADTLGVGSHVMVTSPVFWTFLGEALKFGMA